jgi:adenosylhomocysteine nucleosidase
VNAHPTYTCVAFALARESKPFLKFYPTRQRQRDAPCRAWLYSEREPKLLIIETGVGAAKTGRALDWLARRTQAEGATIARFIAAGFAGGLENGVHVGDVILAAEVIDPEGNNLPTTLPRFPQTFSGPHRTVGRLLSSPRLIGEAADKHRVGALHQAQAVDMESGTAARFCAERSIPFGCVRAISDSVDTSLSPHLLSLLAEGEAPLGRVLKTLVRHPGLLGPLLTLARNTRLAALRLAECLQTIVAEPLATV